MIEISEWLFKYENQIQQQQQPKKKHETVTDSSPIRQ